MKSRFYSCANFATLDCLPFSCGRKWLICGPMCLLYKQSLCQTKTITHVNMRTGQCRLFYGLLAQLYGCRLGCARDCQWHLTHWGRVTHICVGNLTIIGSDNGLAPHRRQAIIWSNAGILLIGLWGTNFNEILIGIQTFSFKKIRLKMSSAKWRPFCLGLNVLKR